MYSKEEEGYIWLTCFDLTVKKAEEIVEKLGAASLVVNFASCDNIFKLEEGLYVHMKLCATREFLSSYLKNLESLGIVCLTKASKNYPKKLIDLPDAPCVIFAKGNLELLNRPCLAVVGSRMPSNYGKSLTEDFTKKLAKAGLVIVSGLAFGVDSIAHRTALEVGGKTIAVLAGGFNHVYPDSNTNLFKEICEKGLVLSEYKPSFKPTKYTFPLRNRIIAGVSDGVLLTEAAEKSGSLHTKNYALDYGREVFAIPGNITSAKSEGVNKAIRAGHAHVVLEAEDILMKFSLKEAKKVPVQLNFNEEMIFQELEKGEVNLTDLAEKTKISLNTLISCLTTLEIRGIIKKLPGNVYMKCGG